MMDKSDDRTIKIGHFLQIFLDKEIGRGRNGTVVYQGTYPRQRPVAVKCLSIDEFDAKVQGFNNCDIGGDGCLTFCQLHAYEGDENFVYVITPLCDYNLRHLVQNKWLYSELLDEHNGYPTPYLFSLMRDVASGLQSMHAHRTIYGDLNPSHVLIDTLYDGSRMARLSLVGSCRLLAKGEPSLRSDAIVSGTPGWRSPEQVLVDLPQTPAMDVFNYGCVLFFLMTGGAHPFGESDDNVANNIVDLSLVEHVPEAMDLISQLLAFVPQLRPKASQVLLHPIFWNSYKRLSFLKCASERANGEDKEARDIAEALEREADKVLCGVFNGIINSESIAQMEQHEPFRYVSVQQLLCLINAKVGKLRRIDEKKIKMTLETMMDVEDQYVRERFPNLLMVVYNVMLKFCNEEAWFLPYSSL